VQGGFSFGDNPPAFFTTEQLHVRERYELGKGKHDGPFRSVRRAQPGGSGQTNLTNQESSALVRRTATLFGGSSFGDVSTFSGRHPLGWSRSGQWLLRCSKARGSLRIIARRFLGLYVQDNYRITRPADAESRSAVRTRRFPGVIPVTVGPQVNLAAMACGDCFPGLSECTPRNLLFGPERYQERSRHA